MKICRSKFINGKYQDPEILPNPINTRGEYNAYIHPDESYLIYTSHAWGSAAGRGDLFISYRNEGDTWSKPIHLGSQLNSSAIDMSPSLSSDGNFLFFSSARTMTEYVAEPVASYQQLMKNFQKPQNKKLDIYWVEAKVLAGFPEQPN